MTPPASGPPGGAKNVVVVTDDTIGAKMAGPAIRATEMSRALAADGHTVRCVSTVELPEPGAVRVDGVEISFADDDRLRQLEVWADVIVFQGHLLANHPWLRASGVPILVDIYDPFHLEVQEKSKDLDEHMRIHVSDDTVNTLNDQLGRGDFFVCASEKQRDFWLGQLAGLGRINPISYDADPSLRSLIDVAPFGLSPSAPVRTGPGPRTTVPGIGPDTKLILWGGGIYNWFDPETLIRAMGELRDRGIDVALFFMGLRHPNPNEASGDVAARAQVLAAELGLLDTSVFFNAEWVPYDERQNVLLDADIGVSTHFDHVETAFSFRTRILDYLWAGLPVVTSAGDALGDLMQSSGAGRAVPASDVDALVAALDELLSDPAALAECAARSAEVATGFAWPDALAPVLAFCREPRRAPDLLDRRTERPIQRRSRLAARHTPLGIVRRDARIAVSHLRDGGVSQVATKVGDRLRRTSPWRSFRADDRSR